ncbi:hypothetical protein C0995_012864 [Termitomyces sp. Mi166|nr:hypothetical protein C0995_012864 [Termitomyces sp. Mi166\
MRPFPNPYSQNQITRRAFVISFTLAWKHTPEGLTDEEAAALRKERSITISDSRPEDHSRAIEEAAWSILRSKLDHVADHAEPAAALSFEQFAELLGQSNTSQNVSGIPQSVLAVAPHLANLQGRVSAGPYISKTWEFCREYAREKVTDSLILLGQSQHIEDPISHAM